jgi:hypothetical protein
MLTRRTCPGTVGAGLVVGPRFVLRDARSILVPIAQLTIKIQPAVFSVARAARDERAASTCI